MADLLVKELELLGRQKLHYQITCCAIQTIHGIIEFTADASPHHLPKFCVDRDRGPTQLSPCEPLVFEVG